MDNINKGALVGLTLSTLIFAADMLSGDFNSRASLEAGTIEKLYTVLYLVSTFGGAAVGSVFDSNKHDSAHPDIGDN